MKFLNKAILTGVLLLTGMNLSAQEENGMTREVELGALIASGNTDTQSLNFAGAIGIRRNDWRYDFTLDGLYSSRDNVVNGQRLYGVASANYDFSEDSFFLTRASHEDDRFSGFDSQSDLTFSYGRGFLQNRADMSLNAAAGIGVRWSRLDGSDFDEPILRLAGEYDWTISDSARFSQDLSMEAGSDSDIYRSESSIETQILDNLSLRFSLRIKHQTEVPVGRENTDTETAVTLVMNF